MPDPETMPTSDRFSLERWCDSRSEARVRVLGHYWAYVDPKDVSLTPHLMRDGYWESWVTLAVARHVRAHMKCVDAGANVGYYSVLMASLGAEVLAFEPNPRTNDLLRMTVSENGMHQRDAGRVTGEISTRGEALSAMIGRLEMHRYGEHRGSDSAMLSPGYEVTETYQVDTVPLDLACPWSSVDFLKVDVEGMEEDVWRGAWYLRERSPGLTACIEVHPWAQYDWGRFVISLAQDYDVSAIQFDGSLLRMKAGEVVEDIATRNGATIWVSPR